MAGEQAGELWLWSSFDANGRVVHVGPFDSEAETVYDAAQSTHNPYITVHQYRDASLRAMAS